mgnify:CR=1 FL=1
MIIQRLGKQGEVFLLRASTALRPWGMTAVIFFICRETLFLIPRIFPLRSIKSGSKEMADRTLLLACKSKAYALYL